LKYNSTRNSCPDFNTEQPKKEGTLVKVEILANADTRTTVSARAKTIWARRKAAPKGELDPLAIETLLGPGS
jgi:hypothetical protein